MSGEVTAKVGRPSKYEPKMARQAQKLAELGATNDEIADFLGIDRATFYRWQAENANFCDALKVGKEVADERVQRSLYHRAVGYTRKAVKIMAYEGQSFEHEYTEVVDPDVTACIFWLKNRRPDEWRDRREVTNEVGPNFAQALLEAMTRRRQHLPDRVVAVQDALPTADR